MMRDFKLPPEARYGVFGLPSMARSPSVLGVRRRHQALKHENIQVFTNCFHWDDESVGAS